MADETTQFILGDAAADALSEGRRGRKFFRRQKKSRSHETLTHCENCGAPLTGAYCAQCGQHAIDYRRSLWRVLIDAADSFLNWDTKFLKSVGVLLVKPWKLTNDFNAGRRARYVHPLRLYLLASIAFFLIAKLLNTTPPNSIELSGEDRAVFDGALGKLSAPDSQLSPEQRAKVMATQALFDDPAGALSAEDRATLDRSVTKLHGFAQKKQLKEKDAARIDAILDQIPHPSFIGPPLPNPPATDQSIPIPPPPSTPKKHSGIQFDNPDPVKHPFGSWMERRIKDKVGEDGTKTQLFLDTLRANIPTMMLCCIPLFALVLKLLYVRQQRLYIEHLVYALHIHTFAYIATVVITLIALGTRGWSRIGEQLITVALSCAALALVFVSIRRVYRQGWFMTTFKFLLGASIYFVVLAFAVSVTAFVTLVLP